MTTSNMYIDSESEVNGIQGFAALRECGAQELHLMLHNSKAINQSLSINQSSWGYIVIFLDRFHNRGQKYVQSKWSKTNSAPIFGLLY